MAADIDTPASPYFGTSGFPFDTVRSDILRVLDHFFPTTDGVVTQGFKEVRYNMPDLDTFPWYSKEIPSQSSCSHRQI